MDPVDPGISDDNGISFNSGNDDLHHESIVDSGINFEARMTQELVHITNCSELQVVEGLENLPGLKYLQINDCPSLQSVDFNPRDKFCFREDMPQPGYSTLDSAGEEDSAEESFLLEQLNLHIAAYPEKKLF